MYDPKGNAKDRAIETVAFEEAEPPEHLRGIVHRFLELRTTGRLPEDYCFHALPDACTYAVFDQTRPDVTGIAQLSIASEEFNLGREFHFVNIRFLPGVWQSEQHPVTVGLIDTPYDGALDLKDVNSRLVGLDFAQQQSHLIAFTETLIAKGYLRRNLLTDRIFQNLEDIATVADMASFCDLSPRQLQRRLKATTGFSPHDLLKVLRLQQALNGGDTWSYADQSHFIHSFRKATGYTPGKYARKFDV
jgi:AraC-like DNA-binding protein